MGHTHCAMSSDCEEHVYAMLGTSTNASRISISYSRTPPGQELCTPVFYTLYPTPRIAAPHLIRHPSHTCKRAWAAVYAARIVHAPVLRLRLGPFHGSITGVYADISIRSASESECIAPGCEFG